MEVKQTSEHVTPISVAPAVSRSRGFRFKAGPSQSFPNVPLYTYYTPFNWNFCWFSWAFLSVSALGLVFFPPPRKTAPPLEADVCTQLCSGHLPQEVIPGHRCWKRRKNLGFEVRPGFMSLFCHLPVCDLEQVTQVSEPVQREQSWLSELLHGPHDKNCLAHSRGRMDVPGCLVTCASPQCI